MRKTLIYLLLLVILGAGVYFFLFSNKALFTKGEDSFKIRDTADIGKIFLSDQGGRSILLERTDSGWMVNKTYKALASTLQMLMTTFTQQAVLYPAPDNSRNNVIKDMAGNAIKTEIYNRNGDKMKTFYVGGATPQGIGSYMLAENDNKPYVVIIANFQGYLTSRYTTDIKFWRDRTVFNFSPQEIKNISVQYPAQDVNSFTLEQGKNNSLTVSGNPEIVSGKTLNTRRANVYLKYFQNINCEGYFNNTHSGVDTVLKIMPKYCIIDLTAFNGKQQHVDIYWMPLNKRSKNITVHAANIPDDYDADHFFGVMNNYKDTVLLQRYVLKKLFRAAYEFYEADPPESTQPQRQEIPKNVLMHKNS